MTHNRYFKVIIKLLVLIVVILALALLVYLPQRDSPSMVYYENQEFRFSIEYPNNWELNADNRVANDFSLETSRGLFSKQGAWIYLNVSPAFFTDPTMDIEELMDNYLQIYGRTHPWDGFYEIVQVSSVRNLNNHEIISGTLLIPTLYIDERSPRNQLDQRDANVFQTVHIYKMRNIYGDEMLIEIYEGRNSSINEQAKQIVQSIHFLHE